jgi:hypothetical protein
MTDWNWRVCGCSPSVPEETGESHDSHQHILSFSHGHRKSDSDVQLFIKFAASFVGYLTSMYLLQGLLGAEDDIIIRLCKITAHHSGHAI